MQRPIWPLAALALTLALTGCSAGADSKASEAQVKVFHDRLDAGNYAQIYKASGPDLKAARTEQDFTRLLTAIHTTLGKTAASDLVQTTVFSGMRATNVVLTYKTQFERGAGVETFTYTIAQPSPVLSDYKIESEPFIFN